MNKVEITGKIISDINIEVGNFSECRFFIEVKRERSNVVDKMVCRAFNKTAEEIAGTFKKGYRIKILGKLRTVPLRVNGETISFLEIVVSKAK